MGKSSDSLTHPAEQDIIAHLRVVRGWTPEQKLIIQDNVITFYRKHFGEGMPKVLASFNDFDFLLNLSYDEMFCKRANIPYHRIDEFWEDLRAAVADFYWLQLAR